MPQNIGLRVNFALFVGVFSVNVCFLHRMQIGCIENYYLCIILI